MNKIKHKNSLLMLVFVTVTIGIVSGLTGMCLDLLLHCIEHIAYGYSPTTHPENVLQGISASSSQRRIFVLMLCGVIAGVGWVSLDRYGQRLVSIREAVKASTPRMPIKETIINALLQVITVALGSPLGREVAPREIGALFACWLSEKTGLKSENAQIMVACGAGAGLAAVYNVPLGGTLFILEVLLKRFSVPVILPALATCAIATAVSWIGLGTASQYHIAAFTLSYSLVVWSVFAGPVFGIAAWYFNQLTMTCRQQVQYHRTLLICCIFNFTLIGCLAAYFPALLGNGKDPVQLGFSNDLTVDLAITLFVLRVLIVCTSLRVGAKGGLLTPSLANGVLLAVVLGGFWSMFWPGTPLGAFTVIGAAAFLAASQKIPITAIVLTAEFTSINFNFLVPILFAVAGAMGSFELCERKYHVSKNLWN